MKNTIKPSDISSEQLERMEEWEKKIVASGNSVERFTKMIDFLESIPEDNRKQFIRDLALKEKGYEVYQRIVNIVIYSKENLPKRKLEQYDRECEKALTILGGAITRERARFLGQPDWEKAYIDAVSELHARFKELADTVKHKLRYGEYLDEGKRKDTNHTTEPPAPVMALFLHYLMGSKIEPRTTNKSEIEQLCSKYKYSKSHKNIRNLIIAAGKEEKNDPLKPLYIKQAIKLLQNYPSAKGLAENDLESYNL